MKAGRLIEKWAKYMNRHLLEKITNGQKLKEVFIRK